MTQLRAGGMGPPSGLDLTAFMLLGRARGLNPKLLSLMAPFVEAGVMTGVWEKTDANS